jgi:hypothetical protein
MPMFLFECMSFFFFRQLEWRGSTADRSLGEWLTRAVVGSRVTLFVEEKDCP